MMRYEVYHEVSEFHIYWIDVDTPEKAWEIYKQRVEKSGEPDKIEGPYFNGETVMLDAQGVVVR